MYNLIYLNETAVIKIEEGWLDAKRAELKAEAKAIAAKKASVYYTWKNGKLFLFFDKESLGIKDAISSWIKEKLNKIARIILGVKMDEKEINEFQIKKGADIHSLKYVLDYYTAKKNLDAITYNKLCNTWSYLILPGIKGKVWEKVYRKLLKDLNGVALPEDVLKNPKILETKIIDCKK